MRKEQFVAPKIEKFSFTLSDAALCTDTLASSGASTDGGVFSPTNVQSSSAT